MTTTKTTRDRAKTEAIVLESYRRRPGQTFEMASRDTDRAKSTVHSAVFALQDAGRLHRGKCERCGGPVWEPTEKPRRTTQSDTGPGGDSSDATIMLDMRLMQPTTMGEE